MVMDLSLFQYIVYLLVLLVGWAVIWVIVWDGDSGTFLDSMTRCVIAVFLQLVYFAAILYLVR